MATINWKPKGEGWNQLHISASTGDLATLRKLISLSKFDPDDAKLQISSNRENKLDIPTKSGDRAIHIALRKRTISAANELIKAGCDVKALGAGGETLLHIAASKGLIDQFRLFVKDYGLDPLALTKDGSSCVHLAASEDRCDTLRMLAEYNVPLDLQNDTGDTALHIAAKHGSVGAVTWLLEREPELVYKENKAGKDALAVARDAGRREAADVLKEAKNAKKRATQSIVEFQKLVARGVDLESVKRWLDKPSATDFQSIIDSINFKTGSTAFLEACAGGDLEVIKFLVTAPGKRLMTNSRTGTTALHIASARGNLPLVQYLLAEHDQDPSLRDSRGTTPLQEATRGGHTEIIKLLKEHEEKRHFLRQRSSNSSTPSRPPSVNAREVSETSSGHPASEDSFSKSVPFQRNNSLVSVLSDPPEVDEEVIALLKRAEISSKWLVKLSEQGFGTLSHLLLVMDGDLVEMEMKRGDRRALLKEIHLLKEEFKRRSEAPPPPSPMAKTSFDLNVDQQIRGSATEDSRFSGSSPSRPIRVTAEDMKRGPITEMPDGTQVELVLPPNPLSKESKVIFIGRTGHTYTCSCVFWRVQNHIAPEKRTCEHLKLVRGESAERLRLEIGSMGLVSKRLGTSVPRAGQSSAEVNRSIRTSTSSTATMSQLSDRSKRSLTEMRKQRVDDAFDVPAHFVVKWDQLRFEDQIFGEGSFGIVRIATWRGMQVAVKELKLGIPSNKGAEISDLRREAFMMSRVCNHENVVPLYGLVLDPVPCVIMPFMPGGSLEDLMVIRGPINIRHLVHWYAVLKMFRDAAAGILHLHYQKVIHRDIAARNLLVDAQGAVRVADFGFARVKEENRSRGWTISDIGPIKWMAPEAIDNQEFSEKSDVFSFGVTMWEILKGQKPWKNSALPGVISKVGRGERMELPKCPDPAIRQLIDRCWSHDKNDRPNMKDVLDEIDEAWKRARGHLAVDPSGGVAKFIRAESFERARTLRHVAQDSDFDSDDSKWSEEEVDSSEFLPRPRNSFGGQPSGTPAPEDQQREAAGDDGGWYHSWYGDERS